MKGTERNHSLWGWDVQIPFLPKRRPQAPSKHLCVQTPATGSAMTHSVKGSWCAWPQPRDASRGGAASPELPQGARTDGLEHFLNGRGAEVELMVSIVK